MTLKTRETINSEAAADLADNSSEDISAADVRQRILDLADSAILRLAVGDFIPMTTVASVGDNDLFVVEIDAGSPSGEKRRVPGSLLLRPDVEGQGPITGGAGVTVKDQGNFGGGSPTPDVIPSPGERSHQKLNNAGAMNIRPHGSVYGDYVLDITNVSGAGAINVVDFWNKVTGDSFTTTVGDKFKCFASISDVGNTFHIEALQ